MQVRLALPRRPLFGPRPRDYSYGMPRKALREALRSALAGKLRDGEVGTLKAAF